VSSLAGTAPEVLLLPYMRAIELLGGVEITLSVITPPYPVLGCGMLRAVRLSPSGDAMHLDVTYDDFERLA
jgi:hypothetical protein